MYDESNDSLPIGKRVMIWSIGAGALTFFIGLLAGGPKAPFPVRLLLILLMVLSGVAIVVGLWIFTARCEWDDQQK